MDDRVLIFDTTLRDGEQSAGTAMTVEEKVEIARQLERLGVDVIEAGFPISSNGDFEAVQRIAREIRTPIIAALAHANAKLSSIEKVKHFALLAEPFTIENSLMTPTMKIRRHKICERHGDTLEGLYGAKKAP